MAFEDRCSPQSAPSPPGMPHSPQNSSSPVGQHHHHPAYFPNTSTMLNHHPHHNHLLHQQSAAHSPDMSTSPHERLSPLATIKQEVLTPENHHHQQHEAHQQPPIRFSISNILSDNFGKAPKKSDKKNNSLLFRPYDIISRNESPVYSEALKQQAVFLEEMRLAQFRIASAHHHHHQQQQQQHHHHHIEAPTVLDFSRTSALPETTPKAPQPLLFNTFNATSYPKIHEEIFKGKHQLQNNSNNAYAKMPPLGNLCKTVSQIGQQPPTSSRSSVCRSPSSSVCSSSSSSLSVTPVKRPATHVRPTTAKASKKQHYQEQQQQSDGEQREVQPIPPRTRESGMESSDDAKSETSSTKDDGTQLWPAWVYCTRYSDRPSSGPRYRKPKVPKDKTQIADEKRPRTAFSSDQLARLKREFIENRYLTERRRQSLSAELGLNEAQIKIWFQNKRAKIKKTSGSKNPLALQLMAQGLYNHSTVPLTKEEEELEMRMNGQLPPQ